MNSKNSISPTLPKDGDDRYPFTLEPRYRPKTKPSQLKIDNDIDEEVKSWLDVIHEVVTWLINKEKLSEQHCPILIGKGVKWTFIDRKEGVNPDGTTFVKTKPLPNGLILQRGHPSLTTWEQWDKLKELLGEFKVDPYKIEVFY